MHEVNIVKELIEKIENQANAYNAHRVGKVKIRLGKLDELDASSFNLWFKNLTKGSKIEDATLEVIKSDEPGIYLLSLDLEIDEEGNKVRD